MKSEVVFSVSLDIVVPGPVDFSAGSCTELLSRPGHCYREKSYSWVGPAWPPEMEPPVTAREQRLGTLLPASY